MSIERAATAGAAGGGRLGKGRWEGVWGFDLLLP